MRCGYINFKWLIISIVFEILILIISICAFHDRHSSNINPRQLNLITFSTFAFFMERLMGGKVFLLWKNMHFVFVTFSDNLFAFRHKFTLFSSQFISRSTSLLSKLSTKLYNVVSSAYIIQFIGYEPADLTVHPPPPRTAEGGFIFFV